MLVSARDTRTAQPDPSGESTDSLDGNSSGLSHREVCGTNPLASAPADPGRSVRAAAYIAPILLVITVAYSSMLAMPPSAFELPGGQSFERMGIVFFPQGWAFFTKSPRTPELLAMAMPGNELADGPLESLAHGLNAQAKWFFGADRTSRIQEFEYELLNSGSSEVGWFSCEERANVECVRRAEALGEEQAEITNHFPAATLCGDIALVRTGVTPWAYANAGFSDRSTIDELKLLRVRCPAIDGS